MSTVGVSPVLDVVGAGLTFLTAFETIIAELAAGITVTNDDATAPVTAAWALPTRRGLAPGGQLVDDGEQLTVLFSGITRGLPGSVEGGYTPPARQMQFVNFEVNLIRQIAGLGQTGTSPTPTQLQSDFVRLTYDAELVWATLLQIQAQNLVVPDNRHFTMGPLISIGPEGRIAGLRCPVSWVWTQPLGSWAPAG